MKILVSSCLLGNNCKYNGKNNHNDLIIKLKEQYELLPICPESAGGLQIPRVPSEIRGNNVYAKDGKDVTKEYYKGANVVLTLAKKYNIKYAILKEKSPSCGTNYIYDGTFSDILLPGQGITTRLLQQNNIKCYSEHEINKLLKDIKADE